MSIIWQARFHAAASMVDQLYHTLLYRLCGEMEYKETAVVLGWETDYTSSGGVEKVRLKATARSVSESTTS